MAPAKGRIVRSPRPGATPIPRNLLKTRLCRRFCPTLVRGEGMASGVFYFRRDKLMKIVPVIKSGDLERSPSRQVLTPVIDHVGPRPIESVRMRTLHGDALHRYAITVGAHAPVSIFTG
jgi:hypothetical protein